MKYKKSPYLIFNKDYSITNLLTEKRLHLDSKEGVAFLNLLKEMPNEISRKELVKLNLDYNFLLDKKILFTNEIDPFKLSFFRYASIEINSHCNSRCKFCPVSIAPLQRQFIDNNLFENILKQLQKLNTIRWVSLNHYNEPVLDPNLYSKIVLMKDYGLKVRLFTNGKSLMPSFFTQEIIDNLDMLVINLPTIDKSKYQEYTGTKMPAKFLDNIKNIIKIGFPVEISINGQKKEAELNKEKIDQYFDINKYRNCHSYINITNSRSGLLNNEYININETYNGKLKGCRRFVENLSISVDGDVFICCQDYFKKYKVGNISEKNIDEIISSRSYLDLKKKIFGVIEAEANFICRNCNEIIYE